jgi:hypothetical protein
MTWQTPHRTAAPLGWRSPGGPPRPDRSRLIRWFWRQPGIVVAVTAA